MFNFALWRADIKVRSNNKLKVFIGFPIEASVSTQVSYLRENDKKNTLGAYWIRRTLKVRFYRAYFIRAYAIRPYDFHHPIMTLLTFIKDLSKLLR